MNNKKQAVLYEDEIPTLDELEDLPIETDEEVIRYEGQNRVSRLLREEES